ncbi:MAG: glycosyltransferase [Candidatus Bathyarchaeota archaeon]|jgi:cellulose synthase/poly-beta-1,6-N-acetylglucosamine synthase-like glycosyltransferase
MSWEVFGIVTLALMGLAFAIYVGYYIYILKMLGRKSQQKADADFRPRITVIVPTYNDAETIDHKLVNLIEQSYPKALMEMLLIDSNSKDKTVDIARKFMSDHPEVDMKIIVENERKGKSVAINKAMSAIDPQSEIVIMTDANAFLEKESLQRIVTRFSSTKIGAVVGRQVIPYSDKSGEALSEATYLSFYQKMREGESIIDSTPIFDGELSAYRTSVIKDRRIRENLNADDSQLAVIVRRQGYKAIMEPKAVFYEPLPTNRSSLRIQKVRRGQGLARLFWYNKDLMFKPSYGRFSYIVLPVNFFMHIISPFLLLGLIVLAFVSISSYVFQGGQPLLPLILLGVAFFVWFIEQIMHTRTKISSIALTFIRYQFILLEAIIRHLMGNSLHKWQKVQKKI